MRKSELSELELLREMKRAEFMNFIADRRGTTLAPEDWKKFEVYLGSVNFQPACAPKEPGDKWYADCVDDVHLLTVWTKNKNGKDVKLNIVLNSKDKEILNF